MVFKKPYAFLIKHFRLIHLIITAILVYIVSFSNEIYSFINSCILDQVNRYNAFEYINYNIYIFIALSLILFFIIFWLLKYKDKPKRIYVFSIFGYVLVSIYLMIIFSYFSGIPNNVIDQKVIRAYRDILLIILGFQYLIIIIMFIRGLGFDIKKFNFTKDLQELNLTQEDAEEIELDINIDTNGLMRGVRKRKRELGYFFEEYKIIILGIFAILLVIAFMFGYKYIDKKIKVYSQNETFGYINNLTVKNSYYKFDNDKNYIIVNFDVFKYGRKEKIDVNSMILKIDRNEYKPNKNICYKFNSLGNCYKKQFVTNDSKNYIVVYEVDDINVKKTYLIYKESFENSFKIRLDLENYE